MQVIHLFARCSVLHLVQRGRYQLQPLVEPQPSHT